MNRRDLENLNRRLSRLLRKKDAGSHGRITVYSSTAQAVCAIATVCFTVYVFWDGLEQRRQAKLGDIKAFEESIRPLLNVVTEGSPPSIKIVNHGGGTAIIKRIDVLELPAIQIFSTSKRINITNRSEFQQFQEKANRAARRILDADSLEAISNNKNTPIRMNIPVGGTLIPKDGEKVFVFVKDWDQYISELSDFERQLLLNWGNNISVNGTIIYIEYESYTGRCRYSLKTAVEEGEGQGDCDDVKNIGFLAVES